MKKLLVGLGLGLPKKPVLVGSWDCKGFGLMVAGGSGLVCFISFSVLWVFYEGVLGKILFLGRVAGLGADCSTFLFWFSRALTWVAMDYLFLGCTLCSLPSYLAYFRAYNFVIYFLSLIYFSTCSVPTPISSL